jgi:serine/threonine-protein kinase
VHEAQPGEILLGKYRVEEVIGIGGMGRVIKASHLYLQQPVAIKILLPQMAESQSTVARFLREAQSTVRLRSEHIARVMDVGTMHDGTPFMVMEFLEGHDLNQILRHHGPQVSTAVVDLMLQACEGMAEAHSLGIIHRDIKPSNFFVTRRNDGSDLLKILDFGISKTPAEVTELTGTQTVIGTPTYMAPEQMVSARSTDPRSDIWSMGVVMYQMLAGRPPFEAETYAQLVIRVGTDAPTPLHVPLPAGLAAIVMRCLEKDPKNRIQNVSELARMLAPYASDPLSAQQAAERASRILSGGRASHASMPMMGAGNGLSLTPPALTPRSWNQTNGSSLSGGAGQMGTRVVRSGRGVLIAGVAALCVIAGIGGFVVSNRMKGDDARPSAAPAAATATAPTKPPPATPSVAKPTTATTDATKAAATTDTTKSAATTDATKTAVTTNAAKTDATKSATDAAKTDATKSATDAAKTDAAKTAAKTDATKAVTKTTATTKATKSTKTVAATSTKATKATKKTTKSTKKATKATKTTKTTAPSGGGLFDDRK